MTDTTPTACPSCGVPGGGKFCVHCGALRASTPCPACGARLSPVARFCPGCGHAVGSSAVVVTRDRMPWLVAGAALLALLAVLLLVLSRESPGPAVGEPLSP